MGNHAIANTFKGGEIQRIGNNLYPCINGRLRLCHEECHDLSIATRLIKFDGITAIVKAVSTTTKGSFSGHGMADIGRDEKSDISIVELAENRAIARSLRISGYGLEYECFESFSTESNNNGSVRPAKLPSSEEVDALTPIETQTNSQSKSSIQ